MTNEKAIMCLEDMKIKVPIPKAAKQARENNEALDVAIKALAESEHGTNLAEVGTDCSEFPNNSDAISRQAAIDALDQIFDRCEEIEAHLPEGDPDRTGYKMYPDYMTVWKYLHQLPTAQPEIIRCTECKHYREYDSEYVANAVVVQCMADRYPISETIPDGWFCAGAERKDDE